ncbi:MAG: hypothetical protein ACT4OK_20165 [Gemmobacter sp.]
MQPTTIISALAHECRKSLLMLDALADARAQASPGALPGPLTGVILRRRRSAAVFRGLLRAAGIDRTLPPLPAPKSVDVDAVIAAEARFQALLERQLARPDLPDTLRTLIAEQREDVIQSTLILSRLRSA